MPGGPLITSHQRLRLFAASILLTLLAACAATPGPPDGSAPASRPDADRLTAYEFTGRIAVKQQEQGSNGNIRWVKQGPATTITLSSPLGQVVARIESAANDVTLTLSDGRQYQAADGETLTKEILGYTVPVRGLNYWVLGLAAPAGAAGTSETTEPNTRADGLLDHLRQDGWLISYPDYLRVDDVQLPRRIVLNRDDLEIRLVIDQWTLGTLGTSGTLGTLGP